MTTPDPKKVRVEFNRRVPMRDGITLSADIYFPIDASASKKYPIILTRTPYMKLNELQLALASYYAEHGYIFVAMDVRGRGDSDGQFVPYINDGQDGTMPLNGAPRSPGRIEILAQW